MDNQHNFSVGEMVRFRKPQIFWGQQLIEGRIDRFMGRYIVFRPDEVPGKTMILEFDDIEKIPPEGGRRTKRSRKSRKARKSRRRYAK
jgi:hypothetical protein